MNDHEGRSSGVENVKAGLLKFDISNITFNPRVRWLCGRSQKGELPGASTPDCASARMRKRRPEHDVRIWPFCRTTSQPGRRPKYDICSSLALVNLYDN